MTNTESQHNIKQLQGPDAVLIPKSHRESVRERTTAIRKVLKKGGFCNHFKTSEEIISGVSKFLSETQSIPHGHYIADRSWRDAFKTDNMYDFGLLHSLNLFIAAKIHKENPLNTYVFCENSEGKYYVVLKCYDTVIHIEREFEHCLYATKQFPQNFQELIANLRVDLHSFKMPVRPT